MEVDDLNSEQPNSAQDDPREDYEEYDSLATSEAPLRDFEDLTLAELMGELVRRPVEALNALRQTLQRRTSASAEDEYFDPAEAIGESIKVAPVKAPRRGTVRTLPAIDWRAQQALLASGSAFLLALLGSLILVTSKSPQGDGNLIIGAIPLLLGATLLSIIAARTYTFQPLPPLEITVIPDEHIEALNAESSEENSGLESIAAISHQESQGRTSTIRQFLGLYGLRLALVLIAAIWAFGSWAFNTDNTFSPLGVFCWIMSVVTLVAALLDGEVFSGTRIRRFAERLRQRISQPMSFRLTWTTWALVAILLLGGWYYLGQLSAYPPEMTSDHVEKLLDAVRVYEGARPIFFPNNGGREGFQMYYLATLKTVTGLPFSFDLLKIGTGIEGLLLIVCAFWLGRAVIGEEDRALGNLTGVILAALIATSYWVTLLSRLGLRIITTPLVVTIFLIFLVRALRHNRRIDYLIAGFTLGAGMYFYQAIRILPLVAIAGLVLALVMRARSGKSRRQYLFNFGALVVVSIFVFIPLGHYMVDNPTEFWERTTGRLFGDAHIENADGTITPVPFSVRYAAFQKNLPILIQNIGKSALMFNWKGDTSWFNGDADQIPALDYFAGALFVIGLGFMVVRITKRRDPVDVLLPLSIVIMLLPTALSIAFPIEVPSFTRASGAIPMVYLLAALALAILIRLLLSHTHGVWLRRLVIGAVVLLYLGGAVANYDSYFVTAMSDYRKNSLPHLEAGQILKGFADSTGAPGNAFIISYKYWMDHRAIGIEAGYTDWVNTIPDPKGFPESMYSNWQSATGTQYEFKPNRQLLFFLNQADTAMTERLKQMFPDGSLAKITTWDPSRDFNIYVVPPQGCAYALNKAQVTTTQCVPIDPAAPDSSLQGILLRW